MGTATNLVFFFLVVDILSWDPTSGALGAFIIAVSQNYLLNNFWTFSRQMQHSLLSLQGYSRFMFVALGGFGINLIVL